MSSGPVTLMVCIVPGAAGAGTPVVTVVALAKVASSTIGVVDRFTV